jgi:hypothetical protein
MTDFSSLNAAITALTAQVQATETTEAGAVTLINGFSQAITKAVADALQADDAADTGSIQAANEAIAAVTTRFSSSGQALGDAVLANTPGQPPTPSGAAPQAQSRR